MACLFLYPFVKNKNLSCESRSRNLRDLGSHEVQSFSEVGSEKLCNSGVPISLYLRHQATSLVPSIHVESCRSWRPGSLFLIKRLQMVHIDLLGSSRNASPPTLSVSGGEALRDDPNNDCGGDNDSPC